MARRERPNLWHLLRELPLFSDLYLNMQAMNLGITEPQLEEMEANLFRLYMEIERTPTVEVLTVSAWTQMWIFGLYELLRTWRQRTDALMRFGEKLAACKSPAERTMLCEERKAQVRRDADHTVDRALFHQRDVDWIATRNGALARLRAARAAIEQPFRDIEAVRITLAKHEVPKSKGLPAQAPGYGRIQPLTGSICFPIILKDGSMVIPSRRDLADDLRRALLRAPGVVRPVALGRGGA